MTTLNIHKPSTTLERCASAFVRRAFPGYRRHAVFLHPSSSVALSGGYFDGGSITSWHLFTTAGAALPTPSYPTRPPQFGGGSAPTHEIAHGTVLVSGGTFCGRPAVLGLHMRPEDISAWGMLLSTRAAA